MTPLTPIGGDPVTLGEVDRNVQRVELALTNLDRKLDYIFEKTVTKESLEKEIANVRHEISDLEEDIQNIKDERKKSKENARVRRNLMWAALVYPTLVLLVSQALNIYFTLIVRHK